MDFALLFLSPFCDIVAVNDENVNEFFSFCSFNFQFYVTDPSQIQEQCTRHQFFLQIRRDIYLGKLECPLSTQYLLASYAVQGN